MKATRYDYCIDTTVYTYGVCMHLNVLLYKLSTLSLHS